MRTVRMQPRRVIRTFKVTHLVVLGAVSSGRRFDDVRSLRSSPEEEESNGGGRRMDVGLSVGEEEEGGVLVVGRSPYERVVRMASGNAVVVFSVSGCCMCHVVKRLLLGLGVGPTVYELDQELGGREIQAVLAQLLSAPSSSSPSPSTTTTSAAAQMNAAVPAVFVGGKLLGGVEKVMSCHINGSLVPLLKQAGALWL
uniref:Glutaredoxin-C5 n=2 Tax=Elaeis guineensis var. tenera TaxID=51953 RepID=A0A6J0PMH2_ELAGV|nr:glutaredoxin-C5 [Elaeis guineensis]